jgi:ferritin-like metal-binding protein YciE
MSGLGTSTPADDGTGDWLATSADRAGPRPTNLQRNKSMNTRDELIDWMRDAYAMERGLEITLEKQSKNDDLPLKLRTQAEKHLQETRRHAEALKGCLDSMGAGTSTLKTGMAKGMEMLKGTASMLARDEEVKDLLAAYASEHFEIACYTALRAGAEQLGEPQVVSVCDSIIPDETRMADWLLKNLPSLVSSYLMESELAESK